jgi:hypothetical protein
MSTEHPEAVEYAAAAPELERANAEDFEPVTIRIKLNPGHRGTQREFEGWIVPGTDKLLAIDQRYPPNFMEDDAVWFITHLPTGVRVSMHDYTRASTKARAAQIAQQFFREYTRRGWSLAGSDHEAIAARVRLFRNTPEWDAFWRAVGAP